MMARQFGSERRLISCTVTVWSLYAKMKAYSHQCIFPTFSLVKRPVCFLLLWDVNGHLRTKQQWSGKKKPV